MTRGSFALPVDMVLGSWDCLCVIVVVVLERLLLLSRVKLLLSLVITISVIRILSSHLISSFPIHFSSISRISNSKFQALVMRKNSSVIKWFESSVGMGMQA